jgi:hypothetical protein
MPRLMFACPSTGQEFASGIHTDEHSLASVAQMPVTLQCPFCGRTHRVTAKSGHLEAAPGPRMDGRGAGSGRRQSRAS